MRTVHNVINTVTRKNRCYLRSSEAETVTRAQTRFFYVRYEMFQNSCKECPEPEVPLHLSGKTIGRILDDGLAKQIYKAMLPSDIGSVSSKPTEQGQTDAQRR